MATAVTPLVRPGDAPFGRLRGDVMPGPSWPLSFLPQHLTPPTLVMAQSCVVPAVIGTRVRPAAGGVEAGTSPGSGGSSSVLGAAVGGTDDGWAVAGDGLGDGEHAARSIPTRTTDAIREWDERIAGIPPNDRSAERRPAGSPATPKTCRPAEHPRRHYPSRSGALSLRGDRSPGGACRCGTSQPLPGDRLRDERRYRDAHPIDGHAAAGDHAPGLALRCKRRRPPRAGPRLPVPRPTSLEREPARRDSNSDRERRPGSVIASDAQLRLGIGDRPCRGVDPVCARRDVEREGALRRLVPSGCAAPSASSPSIRSLGSSVNQRRYVPTSRSSVFSQYW